MASYLIGEVAEEGEERFQAELDGERVARGQTFAQFVAEELQHRHGLVGLARLVGRVPAERLQILHLQPQESGGVEGGAGGFIRRSILSGLDTVEFGCIIHQSG